MKEVAIGIDIGGTNTVFGLVDSQGNCLEKGSLPTQSFQKPDDLVKAMKAPIDTMLNNLNKPRVMGIGIGAPNGNYYTGKIEYAPNLKWQGIIDLVQLFKAEFDCPVFVTNDANAAAIGEMTYGAAQTTPDFLIVTLGTGVGSGFVSHGKLIYGHDGFAGELGHVIVEEDGRQCGCQRKGCLETYASATGIVKTAHLMLKSENIESLLSALPPEQLSAKSIGDAAKEGDELAQKIFDFTAKKLGLALANAVAITSPKMIVLFGGLANAGRSLLDPLQDYFEANLLSIYKNKVDLVISELAGNNAAILGASALVWNELKEK